LQDYFHPSMTKTELCTMSVLGLAHMGDAVFEIMVRTHLCESGVARSGNLHRATVAMVSAPAQAAFLESIISHLTEEEQAIYRRGRNAHVHMVPKNATHGQYAKATGLETLLGSLWLSGRLARINELFSLGMEERHAP